VWGRKRLLEAHRSRGTKKFKSAEERCNACKVYGGKYEPCLAAGILEDIQKEHKRPCPRIRLEAANVEAHELAMWCLSDGLKDLVRTRLEVKREVEGWTASETDILLGRVAFAVSSTTVRDALDQAAKEDAEAKRK